MLPEFFVTKGFYTLDDIEEIDEEFAALAQQSLEIIFYAILIILERQCRDQLLGGKYWNADSNIKRISSNAPTKIDNE